MGTVIVEAPAERADFVAWVGLTAFRSHRPLGLWDFFTDGAQQRSLDYLAALTTTSVRHWAHHSTFLLAEVDGRPAAGLCGYFEEELGMTALQRGIAEADQRLARSSEEIEARLRRIAPIFDVMPEHEPGTWIVESVATHPDYRRRGLVDALLTEVLARGRQRGATRAGIGVMIGNDRAQRAYEKAGFRVFAEKRHPDYEAQWGSPGLRALCRDL
jgi:ribosomal protein S18 acetylase RimI-like enzyme